MDLTVIETFLKAAASQNLSKTAQQTGYSQSAVTVQIRKLEKELGVPLFERIGKRVYLTSQGEAFVPYANDLLTAAQAAMHFSQAEQPAGVLRIGGVESTCTALLPALLPEFYRRCPQVEVVVRSGPTEDMLSLLSSNELDTVLTLDEKISRKELNRLFCRQEEIIFAAPMDPDYDGACIPVETLCRKPFLLTEDRASYRYALQQHLNDRDLIIRPILEIGNTETIIGLLKKGMGISFLPRFTVDAELRAGNLMELHTALPAIHMYHQLFCHQGKWLTPQLKIFLSLVKEFLGGEEAF